MPGGAESLNAGVAAGVVLYEASRRRAVRGRLSTTGSVSGHQERRQQHHRQQPPERHRGRRLIHLAHRT